MKTLEKTTQAEPAQTIDQEITRHSRDIGIPAPELKQMCIRAGLDQLQRGELKARALRPDQRTLTVTLVIETHVALQKLASQTGRSVNDLAAEVLTKAAHQVTLTTADCEAMAEMVRKSEVELSVTPPQGQASGRTTTVELDAEIVAKLRACLRVIRSGETLEEFITQDIENCLQPHEIFERLIPIRYEHLQEEIDAKLARIRQGDKRLVRPEPMPRNAVVYQQNMERLEVIAAAAGSSVNSALNAILAAAANECDRGAWSLVPNSGGAAA